MYRFLASQSKDVEIELGIFCMKLETMQKGMDTIYLHIEVMRSILMVLIIQDKDL